MKKILLFTVALFCYSAINAQTQEPAGIKWYDVEEAFELQKTTPKKILIDFYTTWCKWCKEMDKQTFADAKVAEYLNKNFYCVKFNAESRTSITINDQEFSPKRGEKGHPFAATVLGGKLSFPSTAYFDESGALIVSVSGFYPPEKFLPIIMFLGDNAYKTKTYDEFVKGLGN